jgi:hypothetical protein
MVNSFAGYRLIRVAMSLTANKNNNTYNKQAKRPTATKEKAFNFCMQIRSVVSNISVAINQTAIIPKGCAELLAQRIRSRGPGPLKTLCCGL